MTRPFRFRHFVISQERAPHKVGTDGVLLGAWARGGDTILDLGTGTGLLALMMRQRFPSARIAAVEVCHEAFLDARHNTQGFRIELEEADAREWGNELWDSVVCNPPFFSEDTLSPSRGRALARSSASLSFEELFATVSRLLAPGGRASFVIPYAELSRFCGAALREGFVANRLCRVRTSESKPVRRALLEVVREGQSAAQTLQTETLTLGSEEYRTLVSSFYL